MAEIHRKTPIIKKRMTSFHKKGSKDKPPQKKNIHVERVKAGAGRVFDVLKHLGSELQKPETQGKIGQLEICFQELN